MGPMGDVCCNGDVSEISIIYQIILFKLLNYLYVKAILYIILFVRFFMTLQTETILETAGMPNTAHSPEPVRMPG